MTARAEIRLSLELKPLPIPYPAVKHDDGENFGYKSLVANPEAIYEIPELDAEHAMQEFVGHINAPGGVFETVRMVHWFNKSDPSVVTQCLCLGFIFRDRSLFANYGSCLQFAGQLLHHSLASEIQFAGPPLLETQPAHLLNENLGGWVMDIYLAGSGGHEDAARQHLGQVLASMCPLF